MKSSTAGFMLIELAIYCALSAFLSLMVCTVAIQQINRLKIVCSAALQEGAAHCSLEKIVHKIHALAPERNLWKSIDEKLLVIQTPTEDIGFLFEKNNLYYVYGTYSTTNQRWIKKRKELALTNMHNASWRVVMSDHYPQVIRAVVLNTHPMGPQKKRAHWICTGASCYE